MHRYDTYEYVVHASLVHDKRASRHPCLHFLGRCRLLLLVLGVLLGTTIILHDRIWSTAFGSADHDAPAIKTTRNTALRNREGGGCEQYGCPIYPVELTDEIRTEIRRGNFKNGCALTQRGTKEQHIHNQDRGILISPFYGSDNGKTERIKESFLLAVFDGHGDEGHYVSAYLQKILARQISKKLSEPSHDGSINAVKQTLFDALVAADRDAPPNALNGGSTAAIILRFGDTLFIVNVGDSTAFVAGHNPASDSVKIIRRNRKDKPHLQEERARIESMGGKVHTPPQHPKQARAIAYSSIKHESVGLAMSRSIGDWEHGVLGVVAEPTIEVVDILASIADVDDSSGGTGNLFVVVGSDGIFDARQPQFVANLLAKSFSSKSGDPSAECLKLINIASPNDPSRYRDDMTLIAIAIEL